MKGELERRRRTVWLFSLRRYVIFFATIAFAITCSMLLFLNTFARTSGIELTREYVESAAKMTALNIALLSAAATVIDGVRRKFMVGRPVRMIAKAADRIMQGDFSVRIPPIRSADKLDGFDIIADCFNKMAKELSGMETLRTDFITNVSHELKTPLAVIQNYATMLQKPGLSDTKRVEYAKAVTDASRRLANLITNILKLSKLENQQIYPAAATYDLGEQLCECLLDFEGAWEEKELDIETDIADGVMVDTDAELLSLVWNNLFSNAIKFTEPHGRVSVSLHTDNMDSVVRVYDTGCGISPDVGKHIFEKFYQGDTSHATQGNGLGLALVKRVIDIVGGDISVNSEVGVGSVFTVRLRRKADGNSEKNSA